VRVPRNPLGLRFFGDELVHLLKLAVTSGGQGRAAGCSQGTGHDLRGGLPRFLVRISTGVHPARCAGCTYGRDQEPEGELDTGRQHTGVLRQH
jgi:hypothetical protein